MNNNSKYTLILPTFEGPLDLLLHLIDKHEVDIYNIPVAMITEQYLAYLRTMEEYNIEIASDFLVMAATLMAIKSRMLLPKPPKIAEEQPEEDPRQELVQKLVEYRQIKQAAAEMEQLFRLRSRFFSRPGPEPHPVRRQWPPDLQAAELLRAFARLLEITDELPQALVGREEFSIQEKMGQLLELLQQQERLDFLVYLRRCCCKQEMITAFLALLEVVKLGQVFIVQEAACETIWIFRAEEGMD